MLRITHIEPEPLERIPSVNAAPGGRRVEYTFVPIYRAYVEGLPESLSGLLVTSDLQGYDTDRVPSPERRLLGHVVADFVEEMAEVEMIPELLGVGALLAGDLYAIPTLDKRGGLGDVEEVWRSFLTRFRWVTGVAGNHDQFGGQCDFEVFEGQANCHPLHGRVIEVDGLRIAGISGVIGTSKKPWRCSPKEWERMATRLLEQEPDILILHQGPENSVKRRKGHPLINEVLARFEHRPLVIFGHCRWPEVVSSLPGGAQLLNVDYRAVLLVPEEDRDV